MIFWKLIPDPKVAIVIHIQSTFGCTSSAEVCLWLDSSEGRRMILWLVEVVIDVDALSPDLAERYHS